MDYLLEKSSELDVNFNIYQDILQAIKHNNFKRFENIVKKNLSKKEKVSKQMLTALKTLKKYMKYIWKYVWIKYYKWLNRRFKQQN